MNSGGWSPAKTYLIKFHLTHRKLLIPLVMTNSAAESPGMIAAKHLLDLNDRLNPPGRATTSKKGSLFQFHD